MNDILTHPVTPIVLIVVSGATLLGIAISVRSANRKARKEAEQRAAERKRRIEADEAFWKQRNAYAAQRASRGKRGVRSTRPASSAPAPRQSDYNAYDPTMGIIAAGFIASDPTPSRDCDTSSSSHHDSGSSSSSSSDSGSSSSSSDSGGSFSSGDSGSF